MHQWGKDMKTLAITFAVTCIIALSGCGPKMVLTKPGFTQSEWNRDLAQCEYEVTSSTQNVDHSYQTVIGQSLDQAFRRRDLMLLCMKAKGYVETKPN